MKRIDLKAPTTWKELTVEQLRMVVETLLLHLTEEERLVVLLCQLTGIRVTELFTRDRSARFKTAEGEAFVLRDYEIADFCNRLRWILDTIPDELPNPTKMDDYLCDMTFGDWFEADTHFRLYEDDHDLAHFETILPKLGMEPHELDEVEAEMLRMWWNTVMGQIGPEYSNVFAKTNPATGSGGGRFDPFKSLQEMHLLLNDDRPQENERIDNSRLHDVLSALDSKIAKLKAREEAYKKIKR